MPIKNINEESVNILNNNVNINSPSRYQPVVYSAYHPYISKSKIKSNLLDYSAYIYIYHLPSDVEGEGTLLYIPQWPDEINDNISSKFAETEALSRTAPVFSYINSGPRTVSVSLQLHRDMMDETNKYHANVYPEDGEDYTDMFIRLIQSIALPNYHTEGKELEPPMVAVKFGDTIFIKGVVESGISVNYKKPILNNNKYALAEVGFAIKEIDPMNALSISKVGSYRKITRTFQNIFDKYS